MEAHGYQTRVEAINRWISGEKIRQISNDLKIDYDTLRGWVKRYKESGEASLKFRYVNCGRRAKVPANIEERAIFHKNLRRENWGAPRIRVELKKEFPDEYIPSERHLQRLFTKEDLQPIRTRLPRTKAEWVKAPFERVQADAKERLQTLDGEPCCYLSFTDEYTGSLLDAFVFPLCANQSSSFGPDI